MLSCTVDLCGVSSARVQLPHWRSPRPGASEFGLPHLLVRVWQAEELFLGVPGADAPGCVAPNDVELPLVHGSQPTGAAATEGAVTEVTSTLRAKLYTFMCSLVGVNGDGALTDTALSNSGRGLTGAEASIAIKISMYLTLKAGEIWSEISNSLQKSGVRAASYIYALALVRMNHKRALIAGCVRSKCCVTTWLSFSYPFEHHVYG